jgi:hypothetical protein
LAAAAPLWLDKGFGREQSQRMKPTHLFNRLSLVLTLTLFLGLVAAKGDFHFSNVPITTAIQNFARMAEINFILDPNLFHAPYDAKGNAVSEPSLTLDWPNISPGDALARVLRENGLMMVQDKFTTVNFITGTNHVTKTVDAGLLTGTNAAAPVVMIYFADVPLDTALGNIIQRGALPVTLDAKVSDYVDPADSTMNKFHNAPQVSLRWQNLTPVQAVVALCEAYNLVIVKDATTGVVSIKPRD